MGFVPNSMTVQIRQADQRLRPVSAKVTGLVRSVKKLDGLLTKLDNALTDLKRALKSLGGDPPSSHPRSEPGGPGGHNAPGSHSGGRQWAGDPLDPLGQQRWARSMYDEFLIDDSDVTAISDGLAGLRRGNGGPFSEQDIASIKDHLFRKTHPLEDYAGGVEYRRFDPDHEIAAAWDRLREGKGTPTDALLLEHELAEIEIMRRNPDLTYLEAHRQANQQFNWQEAIEGKR